MQPGVMVKTTSAEIMNFYNGLFKFRESTPEEIKLFEKCIKLNRI
jgi:hypothetical protein